MQVADATGKASFAAHITHLPPLALDLTLPAGYPSTSPPEASLSAFWLSRAQLAELRHQLLQLWQVQGACVWDVDPVSLCVGGGKGDGCGWV